MIEDFSSQQNQQNQQVFRFFQGRSKRQLGVENFGELKQFYQNVPSSYCFEVSNKLGYLYFAGRFELFVSKSRRTQDLLNPQGMRENLEEFDFSREDNIELRLIRISPCERYMTIAYASNVVVIDLPEFLKAEIPHTLTNFEIAGHQYEYIEFPPLSDLYIETPYFLSLDSGNSLRIHMVSENSEQPVIQVVQFRCVTFSTDGKYIIGISVDQELCIIDPFSSRLICKRRDINELANTANALSMHIYQINSRMIAVGSFCKNAQEPLENSTPYLHIIGGDPTNPNSQLMTVGFQVPAHGGPLVPDRLPSFRFLFVPERKIFLFSHSQTNTIRCLFFENDGNYIELNEIALPTTFVRGFSFFTAMFERTDRSKTVEVEYSGHRFEMPNPPKILILGSDGHLYQYLYFDTSFRKPDDSMFGLVMTISVFKEIKPIPTVFVKKNVGGGGQDNMNRRKIPRMEEEEMGGGGSGGMMGNQPFQNHSQGGFMNNGNNNAGNMGNVMMGQGGMGQGGMNLENNNNNGMNNDSSLGRSLRSGDNSSMSNQMPMGMGNQNNSMNTNSQILSQRKIYNLTAPGGNSSFSQQGNMNTNPFTGQSSQQMSQGSTQASSFLSQNQSSQNTNQQSSLQFSQNQQQAPPNNLFTQTGNTNSQMLSASQNKMPPPSNNPMLGNQRMNTNNNNTSNPPNLFAPSQNQAQTLNNSNIPKGFLPPPQGMGQQQQQQQQSKPPGQNNLVQSRLQFASGGSSQQVNANSQGQNTSQNTGQNTGPTMGQNNTQQTMGQNNNAQNPVQANTNNNQIQTRSQTQPQSQTQTQTQTQLQFKRQDPPNQPQVQPKLQFQSQSQTQPTNQNQNVTQNQQQSQSGDMMMEGEGNANKNTNSMMGTMRPIGMQPMNQSNNMFIQNQNQNQGMMPGFPQQDPKREAIKRLIDKGNNFKRHNAQCSKLMEDLKLSSKEAGTLAKEAALEIARLENRRWRTQDQIMKDFSNLTLFLGNLASEAEETMNYKNHCLFNRTSDDIEKTNKLSEIIVKSYKLTDRTDANIEVAKSWIEEQERLESITLGFEPRKIDYVPEKQNFECFEIKSRGNTGLKSNLITKSFKQSLTGKRSEQPSSPKRERGEKRQTSPLKTTLFSNSISQIEERKKQHERIARMKDISNIILNEKFTFVRTMQESARRVRKKRNKKSKEPKKTGICFPESSSEDSEEEKEYEEEEIVINRGKGPYYLENPLVDRFFNGILADLVGKIHFDELAGSNYVRYGERNDAVEFCTANRWKIGPVKAVNTLNLSLNSLLKLILDENRREKAKYLSREVREEEEKKIRMEEMAEKERLKKMEDRLKRAEHDAVLARKELEVEMKRRVEMEARRQEEEKIQKANQLRIQQQQMQLQMQMKQRQVQLQQQQQQQLQQMQQAANVQMTGGSGIQTESQGTISQQAQDTMENKPQISITPTSNDTQGNRTRSKGFRDQPLMDTSEMSPAELEAMNRLKDVILAMKMETVERGLQLHQAVYIINLNNAPASWSADVAKEKLTNFKRKFDNLKVELVSGVNTVVMRVTGYQNAARVLIMKGQSVEGKILQVSWKLADRQGPPTVRDATGGVANTGGNAQMQQENPMKNTMPIQSGQGGQQSGQNMMGGGGFLMQRQSPGGNMFQTTGNMNNMNAMGQQNGGDQKPKFGQTSHMQSPVFGRPSFGQGGQQQQQGQGGMHGTMGVSSAHASPGMNRHLFGQGGGQPSFGMGQGGMGNSGMQGMGQMNQGGMGQMNQGGMGNNYGNRSASDFFPVPRR